MGTEDEPLRERIAHALWAVRDEVLLTKADAALKALGIPLPILAWITANPEAAKGLASGETVAVTPKQITNLCFSAFMNSFEPNKEDGGKSDWVNDTAPLVRRWIARLAASPAPSGKAQGEKT